MSATNPNKELTTGRKLTIVDLPAPFQLVPVKVDGIISYDIDNAYPSRMERLINSSVTAKSSAGMLRRFLVGKGFRNAELNDIIVGQENYKDVTALDLLKKIAGSFSYNNGAYIRCQYTGFNTSGFRVEPFRYCRFGELDSTDYKGKIVVYNNWDKWRSQKIERGKYIVVDVYNPRQEVIGAQVNAAGDWSKYKGQVYYSFLDDDYIYPVSPVDVVKWDADTEAQIGIFKNGELRRGFFLKYLMHHTKFNTEDDADDFVKKMRTFQGANRDSSIMILEGTFDNAGNLIQGENVKVEKLEQNINDKMFDGYEKSTQNSIRKAFYAIPQVLIDYETSALGTTSGEALKQAAEFYNQQTLDPRMKIEQTFAALFANHIDPNLRGKDWSIEPLVFEKKVEEDIVAIEATEKRKAQAMLKGSVGGVTALIQLQQSVVDGVTERSAAIAILEEIYGVSNQVAESMLGTPKVK